MSLDEKHGTIDEQEQNLSVAQHLTLVVEPNATVEEITHAYLTLHHPESPTGDPEKDKKVQEAYETLLRSPVPILTRQDAQACLLPSDRRHTRATPDSSRGHFSDKLGRRKESSPHSDNAMRKLSSPLPKRPRKISDPPETWDEDKHYDKMLTCHTIEDLENYYNLLLRMRPIQFKMAWEIQVKIHEKENESSNGLGPTSPARIKPLRFSMSDAWVQHCYQATAAALTAAQAPADISCSSSSATSSAQSSGSSSTSPFVSSSSSSSSLPQSSSSLPFSASSSTCVSAAVPPLVLASSGLSTHSDTPIGTLPQRGAQGRPPAPKRAPPPRPQMPKRKPPARPVHSSADILLPSSQPFNEATTTTAITTTVLKEDQKEIRCQTEPVIVSVPREKPRKKNRKWGFRRSSADNDKENQGRHHTAPSQNVLATSDVASGSRKKTWHAKLHISQPR